VRETSDDTGHHRRSTRFDLVGGEAVSKLRHEVGPAVGQLRLGPELHDDETHAAMRTVGRRIVSGRPDEEGVVLPINMIGSPADIWDRVEDRHG
jgi:hypothetical protein